jgi:hypothetical protein
MSDPTGPTIAPEKPTVFFEPAGIDRKGRTDAIVKRLQKASAGVYGRDNEKVTPGSFTVRNRLDDKGNSTNLRDFSDIARDFKSEIEKLEEIARTIHELVESADTPAEERQRLLASLGGAETRMLQLRSNLDTLAEAKGGKVADAEEFGKLLGEHTHAKGGSALFRGPRQSQFKDVEKALSVGGEILTKKMREAQATTAAPVPDPKEMESERALLSSLKDRLDVLLAVPGEAKEIVSTLQNVLVPAFNLSKGTDPAALKTERERVEALLTAWEERLPAIQSFAVFAELAQKDIEDGERIANASTTPTDIQTEILHGMAKVKDALSDIKTILQTRKLTQEEKEKLPPVFDEYHKLIEAHKPKTATGPTAAPPASTSKPGPTPAPAPVAAATPASSGPTPAPSPASTPAPSPATAPSAPTGDQEEIKLRDEILLLSFEVELVTKDARALESEITDTKIREKLHNDTERIETLFASLKRKAERKAKDDFDKIFAEYRKDVQLAEAFVRLNPKPVAPPTAAPKTLESLRIYDEWPETIINRKPTKNERGGWFSLKNNTYLSDQNAWGREYTAFSVVFKKYMDFIRGIPVADRPLAKALIHIKNEVVDSLREENILAAEALRESLELAVEEWEGRWQTVKKIKTYQANLTAAQKRAQKLPPDLQAVIEGDRKKAFLLAQEALEILTTRDLEEEELENLSTVGDIYLNRIKAIEGEIAAKKNTFEEVNGVWGKNPDGSRKLLGVLRPIQVTDANKNQTIRLVDGRKITLEEWQKEEEKKQKAKEKAAKIHATASREEVESKYERMFQNDESDFISMYTLPRLDEATNTIVYTLNTERLRGHPGKDAILAVLKSHNIIGEKAARADILKDREKQKQAEYLKRTNHSLVYSPTRKEGIGEGILGKIVRKQELGRHAIQWDGMVNPSDINPKPQASENIFGTIEKYNELKKKADRAINRSTSREVLKKIGDLEEKVERAAELARNARGTQKEKTYHEGLQSALRTYEEALEKLLAEKQKQTTRAPQTPADQARVEKKTAALKKIQGILSAYKKFNSAKLYTPKQGSSKLTWFVASLLFATGASFMIKQQLDSKGAGPDTKPAIEAAAKIKTWEDYVSAGNKQLVSDLKLKNAEDIAMEYATLYVDKNNPSSIRNFLIMDSYKLLNEPGRCYGLSDSQRDQACRLIRSLEAISQAVNAPERELSQKKGVLFDPRDDWYVSPQVTMQKYIDIVKDKVKSAKA